MNWIAEVVVDVRTKHLDRPFDYCVDPPNSERISVGHRVKVPFGRGTALGYVIGLKPHSPDGERQDYPLKSVQSILENEPVLTAEMLQLVNWLCYRYACTRLEAIEAMLPAYFRRDSAGQPSQVQHLVAGIEMTLLLQEAQRVERSAPKQAALLRQLASVGDIPLSQQTVLPSDGAVKRLISKGFAKIETVDQFTEVAAASPHASDAEPHHLTADQRTALNRIVQAMESPRGERIVLHGVTGSGKTEVYLQAMAACIANGGSAIVLVPEISLTPQMVGRFTSRFGNQVAVLHSALSQRERRDEWLRLHRRLARIAVGARSAVFAPLNNVRLIVVDEEHETSYKQDETPPYDAREIAAWRMAYSEGAVVFGSATPSLGVMHQVSLGQAMNVRLPQRVNGQSLPPVEVVDMREELRQGNRHLFSRSMQAAIESTVDAGDQAILFLNRRGFASFLLCRNCGDVLLCPRCDISLTLHKTKSQAEWLSCHYCGHRESVPEQCPACAEPGLRSFGVGTQAIEQAVHDLWPQVHVLRMDVDTTRQKGSHQQVLERFGEGRADILIGTQMVAKGLDFPRVTFVGVVAADTMLAIPDYRSAERTFNLLTQVAGRSGRRDKPGRTVIQTFRPTHYAIQAAAHHDYDGFYREEMAYRSAFHYPPYCEITTFTAVHMNEAYASGAASRFERELQRTLPKGSTTLLPASPSFIRRAEDLYRYQVVIKYSSWSEIRDVVVAAYQLVYEKIHRLKGYCVLDVNAGRV